MNKLPFAFPLADDDIFRRRATDFNGTLRCGQWILRWFLFSQSAGRHFHKC